MTPWVTRLIIANGVMYAISLAAPQVATALVLVPVFILSRPWTLVTYMFLHGGLWHLLFNMLGLYFFGPRLEDRLGGSRFLLLYFISGFSGAILSFVFAPYSGVIGASGAVYGVFIGFAYFWPREQLYIWGIIPVEARIMVAVMTLLSLFGGFGGMDSGIAHFAHLGGFAGGFLYVRWVERRTSARRFVSTSVIPAPGISDLERWARIRREELHEVNREELDRIREKIRTSGAGSLLPGERAFLDRFSSREESPGPSG